MFDNTKPNIILITDNINTNAVSMTKLLGVQKIAYILREAGFEVAVINHLSVFAVSELSHLLSCLISDQTLFVGVSNFFYKKIQLDSDNSANIVLTDGDINSILPHGSEYNQEIKKLIKDKNPKCKLVLGGAAAADLAIFKDFDFVVIGYAEISVLNLANHLKHGEKLNKSYRSIHGPVIVNDPRAEGYNFETSHIRYEDHDAVLPKEILYLEVGRGCIFNCTFCSFPMNGKKKFDYIRHRDLIAAELIDNYQRFGTTRYIFVDDTFNDSVEKCKMIYEVSKSLPFQLEYWAFIRLDLMAAHPETIDMLIDSGLRSMFCGIETFHEKAAKAIRKGGSREKLISTIDYIKNKWGELVQVQAAFILGLPGEDLSSINQTIDYLLSDKNNLDSWGVQALRIRHPDYNNVLTNGFVSDLDRNFEKYGYVNKGKSVDVRANAPVMLWENQYTNFVDMNNLAREITRQAVKTGGAYYYSSFELAGTGLSLSEIFKSSRKEIDWYRLDKLKLLRAVQYKELLFKQLNVAPVSFDELSWRQQLLKHQTFTRYMVDRITKLGA
jgi:hypothetical protein